jgi:hypothetical protein
VTDQLCALREAAAVCGTCLGRKDGVDLEVLDLDRTSGLRH